MTEAHVREALRAHLLTQHSAARRTITEMWVPRSRERADLALLGRCLDGFEIKTERDTLRRLPRQIGAYERLFDRCTLVVASRHMESAREVLPPTWGIYEIRVNGHIEFEQRRLPRRNHSHDPEILVRLLWRDEAATAAARLGIALPERATRPWLWQALLESTTVSELRMLVRRALIARDPASARFGARRLNAALQAAH